jgi:hypothetical protein
MDGFFFLVNFYFSVDSATAMSRDSSRSLLVVDQVADTRLCLLLVDFF